MSTPPPGPDFVPGAPPQTPGPTPGAPTPAGAAGGPPGAAWGSPPGAGTPLGGAAGPLSPPEAARWRSGGRLVMGAGVAVILGGLAIVVAAVAFTVLARQLSDEELRGMETLFIGAGVVAALPAVIIGIAMLLLGRARHVLAIIPIGLLSLAGLSSVVGVLGHIPKGYFGMSDALTLGVWAAILGCAWGGWLMYRPLAGRPKPA